MNTSLKIIALLVLSLTFVACSSDDTTTNENEKNQEISITDNTESGVLQQVNITDFENELAKDSSTLIDLRTDSEIKDTGVITGAQQIDFYAADFKNTIDTLNKNASYLIYCNSGNRSGQTLEVMRSLGFNNVLELEGGITNWLQNNKETSPIN